MKENISIWRYVVHNRTISGSNYRSLEQFLEVQASSCNWCSTVAWKLSLWSFVTLILGCLYILKRQVRLNSLEQCRRRSTLIYNIYVCEIKGYHLAKNVRITKPWQFAPLLTIVLRKVGWNPLRHVGFAHRRNCLHPPADNCQSNN